MLPWGRKLIKKIMDLPPPRPRVDAILVLASTSRYRRELLQRLRVAFETADPALDESPRPGESGAVRAARLAAAKAQAVADRYPRSLIVGSDQVASLDGEHIDKPLEHAAAAAQLRRVSGRQVDFFTGLAVHAPSEGATSVRVVRCAVRFRSLTPESIERYLALDQPYDCAGSAKIESLGIALVHSIDCPDPTALIGLPLITLVDLLRHHGMDPLG